MIKLYETKNFYVRPFIKSDITDEYLSWFHDAEVTKYMSHGPYRYTKEEAYEFIDNIKKIGDIIWVIMANIHHPRQELSPLSFRWMSTHLHIGNIALQNISQIDRCAEFAGIIGNKNYWNKGISTEAIRLLFEHGFNKLNLNRIWLGTAETNIGMKTIAIKLGMKFEGKLRDHVFLEGKYQSVIQYGILKREWNNGQNRRDPK